MGYLEREQIKSPFLTETAGIKKYRPLTYHIKRAIEFLSYDKKYVLTKKIYIEVRECSLFSL